MNFTTKSRCLFFLFSFIMTLCWSCGDTPENVKNANKIEHASKITLDAKPEYVLGVGRVEPEGKMVDLYPQSDGTIKKVNIKMGDQVLKDQVLFTIDSEGANEQVAIIAAQIEEQQANIRGVQIDIEKAKIYSETAKRNYDRIKSVYDKGAETINNVNNAETNYRTAEKDVSRLQSNFQLEEARLREYRALQRSALSNVGRYSVKAPANGQILAVEVAVGSSVNSSSKLGVFAAEGATVVVTEIDELYASLVALNQAAFIRQQGAMDTVAIGHVVELSPALKQKSLFRDEIGDLEDRRVREVKIRIDRDKENLIYGARVEAVIVIMLEKPADIQLSKQL